MGLKLLWFWTKPDLYISKDFIKGYLYSGRIDNTTALGDIRLVFFLLKLRIVVYSGIQYGKKKQFCGYESATLVDFLDVIYHESFFFSHANTESEKTTK